MVKFIRADGEAIWVNPMLVTAVMECHLDKLNEGLAEVYYVGSGEEADIIDDKPEVVSRKLSKALAALVHGKK